MKLWCSSGCVKLGLETEHCVTASDTLWGNKGKKQVPAPVTPDKCYLVQIASILALQQSQSVCGCPV